MLTYKAVYSFLRTPVHGEVLDFPGTITCGVDLEQARLLLAGALVDMAETNLAMGEALPKPGASVKDVNADLEEPIHLILTASSRVKIVPEAAYEAA
jgi:hypothetical protein